MNQRCYNPKSEAFCYYGERGVSIWTEWREEPSRFFEWAIKSGYGPGLTIDRIDGNGNYEPNNCRWVNRQVQSENRACVRLLTWNGKTQSIAAWARELGVLKGSLWFRIKSGWSVERALSECFR
jgi:hypothetical protein